MKNPLRSEAEAFQFLLGAAVYFGLIPSDTDPALILDFWLSNGGSHLWNPEQKTPATPWERQIDQLLAKQAAALDAGERRTLFTEVQKIFAEHEPMLYFAAPRIYVATSARVLNVEPMLRRPQALWSPDTIAHRPSRDALCRVWRRPASSAVAAQQRFVHLRHL